MGAQRDLWVFTSDTVSFSDHIHTRPGEQGEQNAGFTRRTISGSKIFLLTLRSLYVISVRCRLEYASEIWSPKSDAMI